VLGIGMADNHHMNGGSSRVSNTYKDRSMFETLYSFCTFVVWVTFKRQDFEIIRQEVNRMLRSDTFNPSLRPKHSEQGTIEDDESSEIVMHKKQTPAEYRRTLGKRPSKMDIVNQRSTVMISILPLPKEEADWLYNKKGAVSRGKKEEMKGKDLSLDEREQQYNKIDNVTINNNIGIIGMPLRLFNLLTLTLLDDEQDKNTNKNNEFIDPETGDGNFLSVKSRPASRLSSGTTRLLQ